MVNDKPVNCELVWREISNYLEGDLDATLRLAMDGHFRTCSRCRSVLEGTQNVIQLFGDERMIEVPSGYSRRLERRLTQSVRAPGRSWSPWSAWLVPVAALLLITGGVRIASSRTVAHPLLSEHAQPAHGIPSDMVVVVSSRCQRISCAGLRIHSQQGQRKDSDRQRGCTAGICSVCAMHAEILTDRECGAHCSGIGS